MNHAQSRARNAEIARLGALAASVDSLCTEYGLSAQYIYLLFRKHGVKRAQVAQSASEFSPKKSSIAKRRAAIAEIHSLGLSGGETMRLMGLPKPVFYSDVRTLGLKFPYDRSRWSAGGRDSQARAAKMAAMYRAGMTLQQIGDKYGITRERVRQLMAKHEGMTHSGGGQHIKAMAKRQKAKAAKEARYLAKYGCTFEQYVEVRQIGRDMRKAGAGAYQAPLQAFINQRNNAKSRGISFVLSFWQWWTVWQESGKWGRRGRGKNSYVMSRFGDQGSYEVGNIYIGTASENCSVQPNNPYRKGHPDHERVMAEVRSRRASRRNVAIAAHTVHVGLPRGVTVHKSSGRFQAQATINGKNTYLGMFATSEEAEAAYLRATGQEVSTAHKISEAA